MQVDTHCWGWQKEHLTGYRRAIANAEKVCMWLKQIARRNKYDAAVEDRAPTDAVWRFIVICATHHARLLLLDDNGKVRFDCGPSHGSWFRCPIDSNVIHISWNWVSDESKLKNHAYRKVARTDCWEPVKTRQELWHVLVLYRGFNV